MLIDPDVFFGDREMDLGYNSIYPVRPGFQDRLPWYQFN
ncbi:MAG: Hypothetical protein AJITA_00782 [Acetilactobacillus jinshanensis]